MWSHLEAFARVCTLYWRSRVFESLKLILKAKVFKIHLSLFLKEKYTRFSIINSYGCCEDGVNKASKWISGQNNFKDIILWNK